MDRIAAEPRRDVATAGSKPCHPELRRALMRALRGAFRRSRVLLRRSEKDDRAPQHAWGFN